MAKSMTAEELQEKIDMLEEARGLLTEAKNLIEDAVRGTDIEGNVEAYLLADLEVMTGTGKYVSRDQSVDSIIDSLKEDANSEEEE